jgi:hypothetical protein
MISLADRPRSRCSSDSVSEAYVLTKRFGTKDPTELVRGGVDSLDHGVVALLHI